MYSKYDLSVGGVLQFIMGKSSDSRKWKKGDEAASAVDNTEDTSGDSLSSEGEDDPYVDKYAQTKYAQR